MTTSPPTNLKCPMPDCTYTTEDVTEAVAIALLNAHMHSHSHSPAQSREVVQNSIDL